MTLNPAGHIRIRDWMAALPPVPLPHTVAPLPYEAIHHYLRRLANTNHLTVPQLSNMIHVRRPPGHAGRSFGEQTRERLAVAAGQPLDRIRRLYWGPGPDDHDAFGRRQPYGHGLRPACRRCAARHGLLGAVPCRFPDHYMLCQRHQLWVGPGVRSVADQLDLCDVPELLRAQRRHERLLHAYSEAAVASRHRHAEQVWRSRIMRRAALTPAQQSRLAAFAPEPWTKLEDERRLVSHESVNGLAVTIAIYPEVVQATEHLLDLRSDHAGPGSASDGAAKARPAERGPGPQRGWPRG